MHWAQDESRCSCMSSLTRIADDEEYKDLLGTAYDRSMLRKVEADQDDTISKAADTGKFKDKCTYTEWEVKLKKYLSTIPRVNSVPLSYIVRYQAAPDRTIDSQGDFIAETIAHFQAHTRNFHQLLNNYFVAEKNEQWISSIEKRANGRDDFDNLLRHYSGEGNVIRRVATSDCPRETLHYKSNHTLLLNTFLYRVQNMFNILHDKGQQMDRSTQVRELFKEISTPKNPRHGQVS